MKKPAHDTRQHILEVAYTLMTAKGYTAVGLAEVVAAAGVPKGSFYYYFKSKEEFGQALLENYFSAYLVEVDALLSGPGTAVERLQAYFQNWTTTQGVDLPVGKCLVVKLGAEVCDLSEGMRLVLRQGTDVVIDRIAQCIAQGQAEGAITSTTPAPVLAASLYQLWLGASLLAKVGRHSAPFDTANTTTQRLLS